jgi:hypothetical protein
MKRIIFAVLISVLVSGAAAVQAAQPGFYLATDRSFHGAEMPHVNLEGPGDREYQLRIYRVDDPADFFKKSVQARRVGNVDSGATARPLAVAGRAWQMVRADLRRVSQNELNPSTRGALRVWLGIDYTKARAAQALALPARDPGRTLIRELTLPAVEHSWRYRGCRCRLKARECILLRRSAVRRLRAHW